MRIHSGGIIEEESSRRNHGEGIVEEESWKRNHGQEAARRHPGRTQDAPRRHPGAPRRHQEVPRGSEASGTHRLMDVCSRLQYFHKKRQFRVRGAKVTLTISAACHEKWAGVEGESTSNTEH